MSDPDSSVEDDKKMSDIPEKTLLQLNQLGCWHGNIHASVLEGGITNRNYKVADDRGEYVVRMGDDIPEHHIVRVNELGASRAAHAAGIAPAVHFHTPGTLVLNFVNSRPMTAQAIRHPDTMQRVVSLIKRCHREVPMYLRGNSPAFWVFHVVRDYAARLRESESPWTPQLDSWLETLQQLELVASPFDIVFGHNDLLAANILDDGDRLWLIDWEYAGFNTPLFDLGGLASNNEFSQSDELRLLEMYFGEEPSEQRYHQYQAMKCASLLRETLWSMVSELYSSLSFDYAQYSRDNLRRFEQAMTDFNYHTGTPV
ncbi:MAG: phosphotransferase [Granulosicoccus sp.]